jgi:glutathione S-transferase
MSGIRIFSYLPNPRIWKSTIAGRLCGVDVELLGAAPAELRDWLWDFEARPLTDEDKGDANLARAGRTGFTDTVLYKTDKFLEAHPFGTVPAAFSPEGVVGIFESNSIMRAVARLSVNSTGLYGDDPYTMSRVDSFLDASLVFARDSQIYMLALANKTVTKEIYERAGSAFEGYLTGINRTLSGENAFIMGDRLTLADICFCCEYALFLREGKRTKALSALGLQPMVGPKIQSIFPFAVEHFSKLCVHEAFAPDLGPFLAQET